jgi:hypothetical protein
MLMRRFDSFDYEIIRVLGNGPLMEMEFEL